MMHFIKKIQLSGYYKQDTAIYTGNKKKNSNFYFENGGRYRIKSIEKYVVQSDMFSKAEWRMGKFRDRWVYNFKHGGLGETHL